MYKVIFDNGKPTEEYFKNLIELKDGIQTFYTENKDSEYQFDLIVLDDKDNDISESLLIQEMINEIIEESE